jgi:alkylmercury lyase
LSDQFDTCEEVLMRLPDATLAIRRTAFRWLASSGRPLAIDEAATIAALDVETARQAIGLVASVGMAQIDGETIVGMDGLTTRPTRHRMILDGVPLWTWCAYDIVGIAAALRASAIGTTKCGACGREIEVVVRKGRPKSSSAIGWLPQVGCSNVIEEFCPSALLFCSREHLETWRSETRAGDGEAMTVDGLADRGRVGWRDLVG